ncbi:MAG: bifunctional methionine sulfoxide reductase B/A protein, partial [Verrucomicrobiota bacterium]|nr:bifunctional methionine sulfoxide reductase B/A protein [Verrucomicrobiota bacterium]
MTNQQIYNKLTPVEKRIIINKETEKPFSGKYNDFAEKGRYICKRCDALLFHSDDKFQSTCGWPSFDDALPDAVKRQMDADQRRTEILCNRCGAHLGHVFEGEDLTEKNTRHCVNSAAILFIPSKKFSKRKIAYFAGGCFWGVEYLFEQKLGVYYAESGYMGGSLQNPVYEDICTQKSGHYETVQVSYNPEKVTYEELVKYFFEIHDPTQKNGQGPHKGPQYLSVIFYSTEKEKSVCQSLIKILKNKKIDAITTLLPAETFWKA